MFAIDKVLISDDILTTFFCCNINKCRGMCCKEGDLGAPIYMDEIKIIQKNYNLVKEYLTRDAQSIIQQYGIYEIYQNEYYTRLLPSGNCIFSTIKNETYLCIFELLNLKKPISCRLYPIRMSITKDYTFLNLHKWEICKSGYENGNINKIPLITFLKASLIDYFGSEWYDKLSFLFYNYDTKNKI